MDERIRFAGRVRRWDESKPGGIAVVDVPADLVPRLGGRRQMRVAGTLAMGGRVRHRAREFRALPLLA